MVEHEAWGFLVGLAEVEQTIAAEVIVGGAHPFEMMAAINDGSFRMQGLAAMAGCSDITRTVCLSAECHMAPRPS